MQLLLFSSFPLLYLPFQLLFNLLILPYKVKDFFIMGSNISQVYSKILVYIRLKQIQKMEISQEKIKANPKSNHIHYSSKVFTKSNHKSLKHSHELLYSKQDLSIMLIFYIIIFSLEYMYPNMFKIRLIILIATIRL